MKAEPRSQFWRWLIHQIERGIDEKTDFVGVFARMAANDFRFPVEVEDLKIIRFHLRTWGDQSWAEMMFDDVATAYKQYLNQRRKIDKRIAEKKAEIKRVEKATEEKGVTLTTYEKQKIRVNLGARADWGLKISAKERNEQVKDQLKKELENQASTKSNPRS